MAKKSSGKNTRAAGKVKKGKKMSNTSKSLNKRKNAMTVRRMTPYAQLVRNPCMGPLVRGVGMEQGVGIVERVRNTFTFPLTAGNSCGYIAWFPSFHGAASASNSPANLFYYENTEANIATRPINTIATPMGSGTASNTGVFYADPANAALSGGAFVRGKTIAACLQLENLQPMMNFQGQIATVITMPLSSFNINAGSTTTLFVPPSTQELLNYAARRERISVDGHEVVWAPNERDSLLRSNGMSRVGTQYSASSSDPDTCFWQGAGTVSPTIIPNGDANSIMGVILVWRGLSSVGFGFLNINAVKVLEMELAPRGLAVEPPVRPETASGSRISLGDVVGALDANDPSWRAHAVRAAGSAVNTLVSSVFGGGSFAANVASTSMRAIMDA